VGHGHGCYSSLQRAIDASKDGDVIRLSRGSFRGGITIDRSIKLVGSGARRTVIVGGGPVVTIGGYLAPSQPTVAIAGVTIRGGSASTSAGGEDHVVAVGGGIEVPPSADFGPGATVTIRDSVITDNRVAPTETVDSGIACPGGECAFAMAKGGGIDTWGALTLKNSTVSGNRAGGIASDAVGGGIAVWDKGALTILDSVVAGNKAVAGKPNGRFAEGGGIYTDPGGVELTIRNSVVARNEARLTTDLPYLVPDAEPLDMNANGGGIHAGDESDVVIDRVSIRGNEVNLKGPNGEPYAFDSGLMSGTGSLLLRNSRIEHNRLVAEVGSSENGGVSGGAIDVSGNVTIENTAIRGNYASVKSRDGLAAANGALYVGEGTETAVVEDTVIADNAVYASSRDGRATVQGAGLLNDGRALLRDVLIADNSGRASAPSGSAQGGGIWNGRVFNEAGPIELALEDTVVTRNRVTGSAGVAVDGGGVYTLEPVTLRDSRIVRNAPDQCSGC
jgi:hypothetical protein